MKGEEDYPGPESGIEINNNVKCKYLGGAIHVCCTLGSTNFPTPTGHGHKIAHDLNRVVKSCVLMSWKYLISGGKVGQMMGLNLK
ncbi:hypothetical protein YC2023_081085 [Brassica napus]